MILRTETLASIRDGMVAEIIDQALAEAFADCEERPRLKKPRSVTLTIKITPTGDDPIEAADLEFEVSKKGPAQGVARRMAASPRHRGFRFDADTDSTAAAEGQRTFDDE